MGRSFRQPVIVECLVDPADSRRRLVLVPGPDTVEYVIRANRRLTLPGPFDRDRGQTVCSDADGRGRCSCPPGPRSQFHERTYSIGPATERDAPLAGRGTQTSLALIPASCEFGFGFRRGANPKGVR
jgi:hypothetical protein